MLGKTWSFAKDVLTQPKRVVDLKVFAEMVSQRNVSVCKRRRIRRLEYHFCKLYRLHFNSLSWQYVYQ